MDQRIKVVDGLRGFAILAVVWHHLFSHLTPPGFFKLGPIFPLTFLANGWLGVNLFFVLSGFVLFYPYVTGERDFSAKGSWLNYYRNRAMRLLPLYYIATIYGFIFIAPPATTDKLLHDGLFMLTATFGFTKELWYPPYNWVMWSLGIEIWFSVLFPFLVVTANKFGVTRTFVIIAVLALVTRYIGMKPEFELMGSPYLGPLRDSVIGRLDDFFVGMFIAWFWTQSEKGKSQAWAKPAVILAGVVLVYMACQLWDFLKLGLLPLDCVPLINNVLLGGLFLICMNLLNSNGLARKIFSSALLTRPGIMCYSIYLWHGVMMIQILGMNRAPTAVAVYFGALAIVTYISFQYIEMNKYFRPIRLKTIKDYKLKKTAGSVG